jgi:hypothetical protein
MTRIACPTPRRKTAGSKNAGVLFRPEYDLAKEISVNENNRIHVLYNRKSLLPKK